MSAISDRVLEWVVKGTLYLLVAFSVATWVTVIVKARQAFRASKRNRRFVASLGKSVTLPSGAEVAQHEGPAARVAAAGLRALDETEALAKDPSGRALDPSERREYLERALHEQLQQERRGFDAGLAVLASIGTTSPFVGLFGTVWGIIHALQRIGASGSASLEVVAAPIGEALVATGIGIAVAVPAVLAYNVFVRRGKAQHATLEHLASTLVRLATRRLSFSDFVPRRDRAVSLAAAREAV